MTELVIGCGNKRDKLLIAEGSGEKFSNPTFLDIDESCNPDVVWNLNDRPLPFKDNSFDEIHAYQVLEHVGRQGDFIGFFEEWDEYWRILKPNGLILATVPTHDCYWTWGDPGHSRVINEGTLTFLDRGLYSEVGSSSRTDYRSVYSGDFKAVVIKRHDESAVLVFVLKAIKPTGD